MENFSILEQNPADYTNNAHNFTNPLAVGMRRVYNENYDEEKSPMCRAALPFRGPAPGFASSWYLEGGNNSNERNVCNVFCGAGFCDRAGLCGRDVRAGQKAARGHPGNGIDLGCCAQRRHRLLKTPV